MGTERDPWPEPGESRRGNTLRRLLTVSACYAVAGTFGWGVATVVGFGALGGWRRFAYGAALWTSSFLVAQAIKQAAARLTRSVEVSPDPVGSSAGQAAVRRGAWDRAIGSSGELAVQGTLFAGFMAVMLASIPRPVAAMVSAGCAVAGPLWIVRHLWLGGVEIQWERGTLAPGRRAVFQVATTDGSSRLLGARFLLRCVGPDRSSARRKPDPMGLKTVALWQAEVRAAENEAPGPQQFVQVEFDIPAEVPATGTAAARPIVWELIVHGRAMWGTVTEAFEVPVGS